MNAIHDLALAGRPSRTTTERNAMEAGQECPANIQPAVAAPHDQAFTLIELLVVIAMLVIGSLLLVPTLARTRPGTYAFQCQNNLKQLTSAWRMYADDNRGRLAPNHDGGNAGKLPANECWVGGWLDYSANPDNTNTAFLVDHNASPYAAFLGPYIKSPSFFKCPADKSVVNIAGQRMPRVRSISMNNCVGTGTRSWTVATAFQLYQKISDISKPTPAGLFVLLDEREDSINDGTFFINPDTPYNMLNYPAAYHNRAGSFSFADGHCEIHRWSDPRTVPVLVPGQLLTLNVILPGDVDVVWLEQHASSRP